MADGSDTKFGQILSGGVLEAAVKDTLSTWLATYLAAVADQSGHPLLPPMASFNARPHGTIWPQDQLPTAIIVNAGLDGEPRKGGDGYYEGDFRLGVLCVALGNSADSVRQNCQDYAAAVRATLIQKRGLGGLASELKWDAERYDEGPEQQQKTLGVATVEFVITIPGITSAKRGPSAPDEPPSASWGTVESTHLQVNGKDV